MSDTVEWRRMQYRDGALQQLSEQVIVLAYLAMPGYAYPSEYGGTSHEDSAVVAVIIDASRAYNWVDVRELYRL